MLSRQNIWIQVALAIVTFLFLWFLGSGRVEASDIAYVGDVDADYQGYHFTIAKTNYYYCYDSSGRKWEMYFSQPVYCAYFYSSNYFAVFSLDRSSYTSKAYRDGNLLNSSVNQITVNDNIIYECVLNGNPGSSCSIPTNSSSNPDLMKYIFREYFVSSDFVDVAQPIEAIWLQAQNDNDFSLRMVQGMIEDSVFHAYWGFPAREDLEGYENMPLRVKFSVKDNDSGGVTTFFYPRYLEGFKPTKAVYSVNDYSLEIPLSDLADYLPTNYNIQYVELYPYYFVDDVTSQENLRAGVKSVIRLNYDGTYDNTIEVLPDDSYSEEDADTSILGMLSNFFTNFPQMMKSLFVPEAEDIEKLLVDMNDWFSERFGFIWYPFDLAFQVVSAFTMGEADSVIEIPAVTLNMLGGVKLWDAFSVDFDSMGIFEYVRFFTSTILACSIADLAILKWREWIGGKNA